MPETTIPDHLPDWIKDHLRRYLESDGEDGHMWDASLGGGTGMVPTLILTTIGRKSGNQQIIPLIYGESGGAHVIVASKGGAPAHPAWYLNLTANPEVTVQVKADRFRARATTVTGDERARMWDEMVGVYAPYTAYQAATEREIPVVKLERIES